MKKLFYLSVATVLSLASCKDQALFDMDPKPNDPVNYKKPVTYAEITGKYMLFDSIYTLQANSLEPEVPSNHHPISRTVDITINTAQPAAYFDYDGHTYYENNNVANQYTTTDKYYEYQRARFEKDSVFFTYYKADYTPKEHLTITIKGYKLN